jgi:hypothetical protein
MSKRVRTLTNVTAKKKSEEELIQLLTDLFIEVENRSPNPEEARGLEEAVEWMKGNLITWSIVEGGLRDQSWDVAAGPRDLMGDM